MNRKSKPQRATKKKTAKSAARFPSKEDILEFVEGSSSFVGKREIARAFNVKGADRVALKDLLREMSDEGLLKGRRKRVTRSGRLPSVTLIDIVDRDNEGELLAVPARWDEDSSPPVIILSPTTGRRGSSLGVGERALARLTRLDPGDQSGAAYEARVIKKIAHAPPKLLGIFRSTKTGGVIDPIDKKQLRAWDVREADIKDAKSGDLVRFEIDKDRARARSYARVVDVIGNPDDEAAASLIAMHALGLPDEFPKEVLKHAEALEPPAPGTFEDLTGIAFVTIDPSDARDHDDAVWAEADSSDDNPGGWIVYVAIADVSWFVRPGSSLDKEALKRSNSVYFPDRVVPMLPERISNDLCSLRENEERSCLCVQMTFDAKGQKKGHVFRRGLMRSRAKLSYQQAQAAFDGNADDKTARLLDQTLKPLWGAYCALTIARDSRAPLNLDLPERKIILDEAGKVADVTVPPRLEAHRLIEEFMIQANVSAAETLERLKSPLVYRVHDAPSKEKIISLKEFLGTLDMRLPSSGRLRPEHFNVVLTQAEELGNSQLVSEIVLRSQSQAEYSADNFGHFGLNLRRYAHFTSPIRRYADLIVHRALVRALSLGAGGLQDREIEKLDETAEIISLNERRAIMAERQTIDRLIAAFLADRVGAIFNGRISGVARTGLFVRLHETGADGFIPASTMNDDYYRHDERRQAMVGDRSGRAFRIGDSVEVRLIEAVPSAGALRFEMLSEGAYTQSKKPHRDGHSPRRKKGKSRAARRRQRQ